MADTLQDYITKLRSQNIKDEQIKEQLIKAGWALSQVDKEFNKSGGDQIPLPPPPQHFGMWVSFVYILLFISLYIWSSALGGILNLAVDKYLPDPLSNKDLYIGTVSNTVLQFFGAMLMVGFPIFGILYLVTIRQSINNPGVKNLRSRKLLIYLTLVVTFLVIIGNLMTIVFGFLGGSTSMNSFAHFAVTLFVAGSIFGYLLNQVFADRKG